MKLGVFAVPFFVVSAHDLQLTVAVEIVRWPGPTTGVVDGSASSMSVLGARLHLTQLLCQRIGARVHLL